jgi:serine/threonine protein kinase/Tol biopolymer transport system component
MPVSVEQIGKAVVASGLMTADELKTLWTGLAADARPTDGMRLAKLLVDAKKLTPFQSHEILAGRGSQLIMGEYSIVAQIGAGGMGQVFKAQHRRMKRIVALKVMSIAAMKDEAAVRRFEREVEAAARLEHPNIVTAYDSGDVGNVKYLVMQFVDGGDLADLVKKKGPLPVEKAVGYVMQTARGLAYAHSRGVIHRDIKPANLLLHKDGTVKVLDMGLARLEDGGDGLTATEQVMGTVDYMSPEQAGDSKSVDARSDIYSLGCTLWYLLTAKKVFEADTMIGRLMKHRDAPPPSLVKVRDDVSWPLEQVFHKMIAKRPQDRYSSMDEVVQALVPYVESSESVFSSSSGGGGPGGSSVLRSAEMASFMNAMGSGIGLGSGIGSGSGSGSGSNPLLPMKPASGSRIDLTSNVGAPESDTDPNRSGLSKGSGATVRPGSSSTLLSGTSVAGEVRAPKKSNKKLIGMGVGGAVAIALVAGIILAMIKKPNEVAAGPDAKPVATIAAIPPVVPVPIPTAPKSSGPDDYYLLEALDYAWTPAENLGPKINTKRSEEFPSLSADELCLMYWSRGTGGPNAFMEVRRATKDEPFGEPTRVPGSVGDDPFLSADGLTLVYCTGAGDRKFDLRLRNRVTRDSPWGNPQSFDLRINSEEEERQPWISPDLKTLLYSSSRQDGFGGRDVWISRRASPAEPFGAPENAGKGINTSASEEDCRILSDGKNVLFSRNGRQHLTFTQSTGNVASLALHDFPSDGREPWLSPDGTRMYFQSRRAGGFGDYDLYVTRRVKKAVLTTESSIPTFREFATGTVPASLAPPQETLSTLTPYEVLTSPDYEWTAPQSLGATVNSADDERHPYLSADGLTLLFDSNRPGGRGDFDLWESRRSSVESPWQPPVNMGSQVNNDKSNESPSLCDDGLSLFFSGYGYEGAPASQQALVQARRKSTQAPWESGVALNQTINGDGSKISPKISFDGLTLVYGASDRGSMGGMDLWYSRRSTLNDPFVASSNFRGPISSTADERDSGLSSDGRVIVFASDREGRGTNLWMAVRISVTDAWSQPVELPDVVNSTKHDAGPALSFDGRTLFFHTDRNGGGRNDLYFSRRVPKGSAGK